MVLELDESVVERKNFDIVMDHLVLIDVAAAPEVDPVSRMFNA